MVGQATAQYPLIKRYSYPSLLAVVVALAVVLVIGLGNPLGQAIGSNPFTAQARSGSVMVLATTDQDRAREIADWANRFQDELTNFLGVKSGPIIVKVFRKKSEYIEYGQAYVPGFHPAMEYCYSRAHRSIYLYNLRQNDLEPRLAHEMVHAVVHQQLPSMPLWLDEGIGELVESYHMGDDGLTFKSAQNGWMRMVRRSIDNHDHAPIKLPDVTPSTFYSTKGRIWYALAYAVALKLDRDGQLAQAMNGQPVVMSPQDWREFVTDPRAWTSGTQAKAGPAAAEWRIPTVVGN